MGGWESSRTFQRQRTNIGGQAESFPSARSKGIDPKGTKMMRRLTARAAQVKSLEVEGSELEGLWENHGKPIEIDDLGKKNIYGKPHIYGYIHPYMHACMHTYIHTYIYIYLYHISIWYQNALKYAYAHLRHIDLWLIPHDATSSALPMLRMHWFFGTPTGMNGIESSSCESPRAVGHAAIEIQITRRTMLASITVSRNIDM